MKNSLISPLCASFSSLIEQMWMHTCYQDYLCSIFWELQCFSLKPLDRIWYPEKASSSTPRKVSRWGNYCITELFSTPVKNQYKPFSLNWVCNWMRWQETSGTGEESLSLIKWSHFIPLGKELWKLTRQHSRFKGLHVDPNLLKR